MPGALDHLDRSDNLRRLRQQALDDSLPHSLLLVGPEGSGKEACALELARLVLCERALAGEAPCPPRDPASCGGCRKASRLAHPDLLYLCPVERSLDEAGYREILDAKAAEPMARVRQPSSAIIPVGASDDRLPANVRAARRFVQVKPFEGRRRVVVVGAAHRMNRQAANAFLKTLEEPPPATLLLLVTHQPHLLPDTVRSRCARLGVPALDEDALAGHLVAAHGLEADEAGRIAAVAGGNARRALDLIDPASRALAGWAGSLLSMLLDGDGPALLKGAELLAKGQDPAGGKAGRKKKAADSSLAAGRDIGIRALDFLVADLMGAARLAAGARLSSAQQQRLEPVAQRLSPDQATALAKLLLAARGDIARNVNVALVLTDCFHRALRLREAA